MTGFLGQTQITGHDKAIGNVYRGIKGNRVCEIIGEKLPRRVHHGRIAGDRHLAGSHLLDHQLHLLVHGIDYDVEVESAVTPIQACAVGEAPAERTGIGKDVEDLSLARRKTVPQNDVDIPAKSEVAGAGQIGLVVKVVTGARRRAADLDDRGSRQRKVAIDVEHTGGIAWRENAVVDDVCLDETRAGEGIQIVDEDGATLWQHLFRGQMNITGTDPAFLVTGNCLNQIVKLQTCRILTGGRRATLGIMVVYGGIDQIVLGIGMDKTLPSVPGGHVSSVNQRFRRDGKRLCLTITRHLRARFRYV